MAHPPYLREKARQLRIERKMSLNEISERLALGKTTVWYWIKDLPHPEVKHRDTPGRVRARAKGNRAMQRRYARLRAEAYEQGRGLQANAARRVDRELGSSGDQPRGSLDPEAHN